MKIGRFSKKERLIQKKTFLKNLNYLNSFLNSLGSVESKALRSVN
jgi:hypothetical protein